MSHVHPKEVTKFMEWIWGIYGELRITRGKVHKYLDMPLNFQTPVEPRVTMVEYLKGVLEDFPEVPTGRSTISGTNSLFQVMP